MVIDLDRSLRITDKFVLKKPLKAEISSQLSSSQMFPGTSYE